ncbi:MAG: DUF302 domain-containing protein [Polyangiaceae bacterium]|nr:DUF302 domain-containing protein [Polyangiaceae bacterium]
MSAPLERTVPGAFDAALGRVREALAGEGFGVLTEIDVRSTLAQKLGVEFRRYAILGACNPPFAHRALSLDLRAGLSMPCNVVVHEGDDGAVVVRAVDPTLTVAAAGHPGLAELAAEVRDKLGRALAQLA